MDPWTTLAKAVVYPIARAIADAWFDAQAKYTGSIMEVVDETDEARAARMRAHVRKRLQFDSTTHSDPLRKDTPQGSGGNDGQGVREGG